MLDSPFFTVRWKTYERHIHAAFDPELLGFLSSTVRAFAKAIDLRIRAHAGAATPPLNDKILPEHILIRALLHHLPPDEPRTPQRELAALLDLKVVVEAFLDGLPGDDGVVDFGRDRWRETWITVLQHLRHVFRLHLRYHKAGRPLMNKPAGYWSELTVMVEWLTRMIDELVAVVGLRIPDHPPVH